MTAARLVCGYVAFHRFCRLTRRLREPLIHIPTATTTAGISELDPLVEQAQQAARRAVVEPPLALLEEEVEMRLWNAVVASQMSRRLVPEILDAIDVVGAVDERVLVVDPLVMEFRNIQDIVGSVAIGVDEAVGLSAFADDPHQCLAT